MRIAKNDINFGRMATLNVDGWIVESNTKPIKYVRTPFYPNSIESVPYNSKAALELLEDNKYQKCRFGGWPDDSDDWDFIDLEENKPVGVHLGSFFIECNHYAEDIGGRLSTVSYAMIYSKRLMGNGQVGYLLFNTKNIHKDRLQLL